MIFMYPNVMLGIACIRLLWALSYALVMHTLHTYDGDWGGGELLVLVSHAMFKIEVFNALQNIPFSKQPFKLQPQIENEAITLKSLI